MPPPLPYHRTLLAGLDASLPRQCLDTHWPLPGSPGGIPRLLRLLRESNVERAHLGSAPRTDMVADLVELDEKGFILTGRDVMREGKRLRGWHADRDPFLFETSVPGVFAVGDARLGSGKRVAAAVGEGSAAVSAVHQYLATV